MEIYNNLPEPEKEKLVRKLALAILNLIKENDRPTYIVADANDIEGLKSGLQAVRLGDASEERVYQQAIGMIDWRVGDELYMQTLRGEAEEKISVYLNEWASNMGLLTIATAEGIPMEMLQHKDVLIQIYSAWVALKIKEKADESKSKTQIITPELFR